MSQILLTDVRSKFLEYFKKNNHQIVPSSNLVPNNDPTLMFTNSGMVQFKNVFTGLEKKTFKAKKNPPLQKQRRVMVISVYHRSCQRSDILDTCKHLLVLFSPIFYAP